MIKQLTDKQLKSIIDGKYIFNNCITGISEPYFMSRFQILKIWIAEMKKGVSISRLRMMLEQLKMGGVVGEMRKIIVRDGVRYAESTDFLGHRGYYQLTDTK